MPDGRFQIREKKNELAVQSGSLFWWGMWSWNDKRGDRAMEEYGLASELRTFGAVDNSLAGYTNCVAMMKTQARSLILVCCRSLSVADSEAHCSPAIEEVRRMSPSITRVWVHTCTFDHPHALANYQARGMVIMRKQQKAEWSAWEKRRRDS
jgi:hypothetical protein